MNNAKLVGMLAFIAVWTLGCSSGGSGAVTPQSCISFTPLGSSSSGTVTVRSAASTCETVTLELVVTDVDGVFGAAFDLSFDPSSVSYQGLSGAGSFLASDGATLEILEDEIQPGLRRFGITRLAVATGIDFVGAELLCTVTLGRVAPAGTSGFSFADERLLDSPPDTMPIAGVSWSGGTFTVM